MSLSCNKCSVCPSAAASVPCAPQLQVRPLDVVPDVRELHVAAQHQRAGQIHIALGVGAHQLAARRERVTEHLVEAAAAAPRETAERGRREGEGAGEGCMRASIILRSKIRMEMNEKYTQVPNTSLDNNHDGWRTVWWPSDSPRASDNFMTVDDHVYYGKEENNDAMNCCSKTKQE